MLHIQNKPIIQHLVERISKCKTIRKIIVCTTENPIFQCKYITLPHLQIPKNLRLSIDYEQDHKLAQIIFKNLGNSFTFKDVLKFV